MERIDAKRVINGTFGEAWCNDEYLSNIKSLQAKIDISKEDVKLAGSMATHKKVTGYTGSGSISVHKVDSFMAKKMIDGLKKGQTVENTIISKLADPDSFGSERIVLKGVIFDDLTLANWEVGVLGTVEMPFTFADFDYIDTI